MIQEILSLSDRTIQLARNEWLRKAGLPDSNIYFVESGSLKVYVLDGEEEQIIRFGYQNDLVVMLDSFLTGRPTQFFAQAIKKTVVRVVGKEQLNTIAHSDAYISWWQKTMEHLVLQQMEREIDILTSSPSERYRRVLKRSPKLFQEIPHKHIANYLRMTPETLSRLKSVDRHQDL